MFIGRFTQVSSDLVMGLRMTVYVRSGSLNPTSGGRDGALYGGDGGGDAGAMKIARQSLAGMVGMPGVAGTMRGYLPITNNPITRGEMLRRRESSFNPCAALAYLCFR